LEIEIAQISGKWKVSQNRSLADRRGVADGLEATPGAQAAEMAQLVRAFGRLNGE
jgi:transcriptional regulator